MTRRRRKAVVGVVFAAPAVLLFCLFTVYPVARAVMLSLYRAGLRSMQFVGLENYRKILADTEFRIAVRNTLTFLVVCLPPLVVVPLGIAMVVRETSEGVRRFVRFAYYLPTLTAGTVAALVWQWLFQPTYGLLNAIITGLGGPRVMWLGKNPTALLSISMLLVATELGVSVMIYMAAMASIDERLYEAARIDGCGRLREAWHVTLPGVLPVVAFVTVMKTIGVLQIWQYVWMLTGGGPFFGTVTVLYMVYEHGILATRYGWASAVSVILAAVTAVFVVLQYTVFTRRKA